MALEDLIKEHDPRKKEGHCPECGEKGEDAHGYGMKCASPPEECRVIIWYP